MYAVVVRLGVSIVIIGHPSEHFEVADGASKLMRKVFGDTKMSCRLIFKIAGLPLAVPIVLEVIFEVEQHAE